MLKFITELTGVLFLTVVVGTSGNLFALGFVLAAMVYLASNISGAHFNPAVSLAAWLTGKISLKQLFVYVSAQFAGALLGASLVWWLSGTTYTPNPSQHTGALEFITVEILFTFIFVMLFLRMMYPLHRPRNPVYGLMVGFAFAGCYYVTEPISGTGLNPAISSAAILLDTINDGISWHHLPVYLFAPGIGALIAGLVFRRLRSTAFSEV